MSVTTKIEKLADTFSMVANAQYQDDAKLRQLHYALGEWQTKINRAKESGEKINPAWEITVRRLQKLIAEYKPQTQQTQQTQQAQPAGTAKQRKAPQEPAPPVQTEGRTISRVLSDIRKANAARVLRPMAQIEADLNVMMAEKKVWQDRLSQRGLGPPNDPIRVGLDKVSKVVSALWSEQKEWRRYLQSQNQ